MIDFLYALVIAYSYNCPPPNLNPVKECTRVEMSDNMPRPNTTIASYSISIAFVIPGGTYLLVKGSLGR